VDFPPTEALLAALGIEGSELPIEAYRNGTVHVYVALPDEAAVANLRPDGVALADLGDGFGISCFAGHGARFKTRMFAPTLGVFEDPATGSAAGPLALHLARHGRIGYGQQIEIRQGEEVRRPSLLYARVDGSDSQVDRVLVGGSAVIVAEGTYRLR
jgi:trans-2,3-dihydro-3-hydroxyanthranilate isomerase